LDGREIRLQHGVSPAFDSLVRALSLGAPSSNRTLRPHCFVSLGLSPTFKPPVSMDTKPLPQDYPKAEGYIGYTYVHFDSQSECNGHSQRVLIQPPGALNPKKCDSC
jgi:hypothetical protein